MNYQPPVELFAPAAVARNQEPSRCVTLYKKDRKSFSSLLARAVTDDVITC